VTAESPSPTAHIAVCSQCGGENSLQTGRRFLRCAFCDATLHVDRGGVVAHFSLGRRLTREEARGALRRWMAGNDTVKNLDTKSQLGEITPVSFPMWLFRARVDGREEVVVEPAAATPVPQLADLQIPAGELGPFVAEGPEVQEIDATVALETGLGWIEQRGISDVYESALVQVPLWNAVYTFDGREYRALVDASTGAVLAAVFPEKAESPYIAVAALGLILFGLEGFLISNVLVKLMVYLATAVPIGLLAFWVARKV